jgi:hypothetical protein
MSKRLASGMMCCVLVLVGCAASNSTISPQAGSADAGMPTEAILDRANLSADEKAAFAAALDGFGQHLLREFGESKFKAFDERLVQSSDYYESLNAAYETNPVFLFLEYSNRPSPRDRAAGAEWRTNASDHFVFHYHPGSGAERDIEIIKREAEVALIGACADLGFPFETLEAKLDSLVEMSDSVSGLFYVKEGEGAFTGGRIPMVLIEDRDEYLELGGGKYSSGRCSFGFSWMEGIERPYYHVRLIFRYLDVLNLLTLDHEVVHAVHYLAPAAEIAVWTEFIDKKRKSEAETIEVTSDEFIELMHPVNNDKYVAEGLATWYMVRRGLVPRAIGIPDVRRMTADLMPTWKDVDLNKIVDWKMSLGFFEKAATLFGKKSYVRRENTILYLGAGSFIEYILAEHGADALHALMSITEGESGDRVRGALGTDLAETDRRWKDWVMDRPSR